MIQSNFNDCPLGPKTPVDHAPNVLPSAKIEQNPMLAAAWSLGPGRKSMRHENIRAKYTRHGGNWNDENPLFAVGDQMQYEWNRDFIAMKWALERIVDFLRVAEKYNHFTGTLHIAKDELINRISEYSCPSLKKDEYKTKENCPLGENCKCLQGVSDK